ncbi:hypothetical protein CPLU01_02617 [Colletotrichum plurivorum]|uniref:Uncharacterized protein n=1 Tax=Colletotrichum plurivorum TaxID=2175906 RepID=A0A8H6KWM1_9PEZI|nr:hypothetical protein CPLU01_02617 [Colletotrichum plurivorum]
MENRGCVAPAKAIHALRAERDGKYSKFVVVIRDESRQRPSDRCRMGPFVPWIRNRPEMRFNGQETHPHGSTFASAPVSINDTADPNGVITTLLVFGAHVRVTSDLLHPRKAMTKKRNKTQATSEEEAEFRDAWQQTTSYNVSTQQQPGTVIANHVPSSTPQYNSLDVLQAAADDIVRRRDTSAWERCGQLRKSRPKPSL